LEVLLQIIITTQEEELGHLEEAIKLSLKRRAATVNDLQVEKKTPQIKDKILIIQWQD
jgi:hypothetical protein